MGQKSQGNKQKKIKRNKSCYQMLTKPEKQETNKPARFTILEISKPLAIVTYYLYLQSIHV